MICHLRQRQVRFLKRSSPDPLHLTLLLRRAKLQPQLFRLFYRVNNAPQENAQPFQQQGYV